MTTNRTDGPIDALDVARYILDEHGSMDAFKLQKLCYYTQGWSLGWKRNLMFGNDIEAWKNGPVVRDLYEYHRGMYTVDAEDIPGNPELIRSNRVRLSTITRVLEIYGDRTGKRLSADTHRELPWLEARARAAAAPGERADTIISTDVMTSFFEGLAARAALVG